LLPPACTTPFDSLRSEHWLGLLDLAHLSVPSRQFSDAKKNGFAPCFCIARSAKRATSEIDACFMPELTAFWKSRCTCMDKEFYQGKMPDICDRSLFKNTLESGKLEILRNTCNEYPLLLAKNTRHRHFFF
jgi:hypothetical protein